MRISYLTLFPKFYDEFKSTSIIKKAIDNSYVDMNVYDLKEFVSVGRVDDKIVGGGSGNLLRYDIVSDALNKIKKSDSKVILMTPRGKVFNQEIAKELSTLDDIIFICPHFEGIDERIVSEVDYCLSIGDYILTGGELASQVVSDALIRLIDGVINKGSLKEETFNNNLLEYPQYALPRTYNSKSIPDIYFSGNHKAINDYNLKQSLLITKENRPDLYNVRKFSKKEKQVLEKCDEEWVNKIVNKSKKD